MDLTGNMRTVFEPLWDGCRVQMRWELQQYVQGEDKVVHSSVCTIGKAQTKEDAAVLLMTFALAAGQSADWLKNSAKLRAWQAPGDDREFVVGTAVTMRESRDYAGPRGYLAGRALQVSMHSPKAESAKMHKCPARSVWLRPQVIEWGSRCPLCGEYADPKDAPKAPEIAHISSGGVVEGANVNCPDCSKPLPQDAGTFLTGNCKSRSEEQLLWDAAQARSPEQFVKPPLGLPPMKCLGCDKLVKPSEAAEHSCR